MTILNSLWTFKDAAAVWTLLGLFQNPSGVLLHYKRVFSVFLQLPTIMDYHNNYIVKDFQDVIQQPLSPDEEEVFKTQNYNSEDTDLNSSNEEISSSASSIISNGTDGSKSNLFITQSSAVDFTTTNFDYNIPINAPEHTNSISSASSSRPLSHISASGSTSSDPSSPNSIDGNFITTTQLNNQIQTQQDFQRPPPPPYETHVVQQQQQQQYPDQHVRT